MLKIGYERLLLVGLPWGQIYLKLACTFSREAVSGSKAGQALFISFSFEGGKLRW
jgi:hypothetical protein